MLKYIFEWRVSLRIIAGHAKGKKIITPKGLEIRPTTDRVKEAIFNIISTHISDSIVLDLFAGTGNLGLEALSRGAKKAYFIDNSMSSMKIIVENINKISLVDSSIIKRTEALKALDEFASMGTKFDIIFLDPPYGKGLLIPCMKVIEDMQILAKDGIIVVEHNQSELIQWDYKYLKVFKEKKYGNVMISIYQWAREA